LDKYGLAPRSDKMNALVMATFAEEYDLVLDENGVPCRRGTMPGNPSGGEILVALGTPNSCDPTSETYWSS
jgi:hypothetical protein